jgi:geranylgeranyl diphosphate synthase, type III
MIMAFNLWLQVPDEKLQVIIRVISMLHNASLLFVLFYMHKLWLFIRMDRIDDIEDDSQLRRGLPVAHKIYGIPQTINSANYVYFLAYRELASLHNLGDKTASSADTDKSRLYSNEDLERIVTGR